MRVKVRVREAAWRRFSARRRGPLRRWCGDVAPRRALTDGEVAVEERTLTLRRRRWRATDVGATRPDVGGGVVPPQTGAEGGRRLTGSVVEGGEGRGGREERRRVQPIDAQLRRERELGWLASVLERLEATALPRFTVGAKRKRRTALRNLRLLRVEVEERRAARRTTC